MEISEIQLLGVVLIIIVFAFIFKIIEGNWTLKAEQPAFREEEPGAVPAAAQLKAEAPATQVAPGGKEIRLVPSKPLKENPAAILTTQRSREIAFTAATETEDVLALVKAR